MCVDRKKQLLILGGMILALILVAVTVVLAVMRTGSLAIILEGEREVKVEIGDTYEEPGVTAVWTTGGRTEEVPVETIGKVNPAKFGIYTVKYIAKRGNKIATEYRRVSVVDSQKPVITLISDPQYVTLPESTYEEEGYTATDNYDGDITDRVVCTRTKERVIYSVSDSFGNVTTVERPIVYKDPTPPVLTLKGPHHYTMTVGQHYVEDGCYAVDNCDGDISKKVQIAGTVDRYTPGDYELTYFAEDSYGNVGTVTRVVTVEPWDPANGDAPKIGEPNGKTIYLTFDDGPGKHTPRLLDVLKKYNVRATFFVVKNGYSKTIAREAREGHTVAAHTASHEYKKIYASEDAYFEDLETIRSIILSQTGTDSKIIRFPGGSSNSSSKFNPGIMTRLTQLVQDRGYVYFDWHVDSKDSVGAKTAQAVFKNVTAGIKACKSKSIIVLQHDIKVYSIDAVEGIIVWGLENGYTFRALSTDSPVYHHTVRN